MFEEKRPTCVTVIGWAWIVVGVLMGLSAMMGLLLTIASGGMPEASQAGARGMPDLWRLLPLLVICQMGVAVLGVVSGINFLKLRRWSRCVLEVLSWLLLLFIVGFGVFWLSSWLSASTGGAPPVFALVGAAMGVVITGVYAVPLAIMLKYLRGPKVRSAMIGAAGPSATGDTEQTDADGGASA